MSNVANSKPFLPVPVWVIPLITGYNISVLFDHCTVAYSMKIKSDFQNAINNLIYHWYHSPNNIPKSILTFLEYVSEECLCLNDEDYQGFNSSGEFDPVEDRETLIPLISDEIAAKITTYNQIRMACEMLNRQGDIEEIRGNYKRFRSWKKGEPFASVDASTFKAAALGKISFQQFQMYAAIRSIEGRKPFVFTDKKFIHDRMQGHARKVPGTFPRKTIEKILKELINLGLVTVIPAGNRLKITTRQKADTQKVNSSKVQVYEN